MLVGAGTVLFWVFSPVQINGQQLNDYLYAMVPGVFFATIAVFAVSLCTKAPAAIVNEHFTAMKEQLTP